MPALVPIQHRKGTAAQWAAANPVLLLGEPGYETDTRKEKRGDGVTAWNSLPYLTDGLTDGLAAAVLRSNGSYSLTSDAGPLVLLPGLRDTLRAAWRSRVLKLKAMHPPVPNTATVVFIDTSATYNGDGTAPYPAASASAVGARNTVPTLNSANTTYLLAEQTTAGVLSVVAGGDNVVLGTYEQTTGNRVFDPARLATVDAAGAANAVLTAGSTTGVKISGLRIIGARADQQARGVYNNSPGGVTEYCAIEDILPTSLTTTNSTAIQVSGANHTIRFNWINVKHCEGILVGVNVVQPYNPRVYGNDINMQATTFLGPDGIQMAAGAGFKSLVCDDNWIDHSQSNTKQGIIIQDTSNGVPVAGAYAGSCSGNVVWGADIGVLPKNGTEPPTINHQKCIEIGSSNLKVHRNFVRGGEFGINVVMPGCDIRGNVVIDDSTAGGSTNHRGISAGAAGGSGTNVEHNTIISLVAKTGSRAIDSTVASGSVQFNIVTGPWAIGIKRATSEANNMIFGATTPTVDAVVNPAATGTGTIVGTDPVMANLIEPLSASVPAGSTLRSAWEDLLGRPWVGKGGAVQ